MLLVTAREKGLFSKERRITIINLRHAFRKERINTQRKKLELIMAGKDSSLASPISEKEDSQNTDTEEEEVDATASVSEIKVTKSSRDFYESHLKNSCIYTVDQNQEKGKVLLINNEFRGKRKERKGSFLDFKNLENLWKELGFRLVTKQNLTSQQMRSTFIEFARHSINTSIVVVIVMTHGGNENEKDFIEGENEGVIYINDVISYFDIHHSPHLHGIPKIFFFQACRGNERDFVIATDSSVTKHPSRSDTLIVYPSQAGFVSIRHETEGSWLMNAVTNVFMRNAHDTHILDMLTMVNNAVAEKEAMDGRVQISNQETFLRKKLFLFPGWPN